MVEFYKQFFFFNLLKMWQPSGKNKVIEFTTLYIKQCSILFLKIRTFVRPRNKFENGYKDKCGRTHAI